MSLKLSLYVLTVIQLMSSVFPGDVTQQQNDNSCCSCGRIEQMFSKLMTAVSQLQKNVPQLQASNSQLQKDVAVIKAAVAPKGETDKLRNRKVEAARKHAALLVSFY